MTATGASSSICALWRAASARGRRSSSWRPARPIRLSSAATCCLWAWSPATPWRPARWDTSPPASKMCRIPGWAIPSPMRPSPRRSRCRVTGRCSPWCTAASTPKMAPSIPICGMRWKSCSSTMRPCPLSRRAPWLWALASGAAFWACSIWKSFRSGWSGNLIWTW